jgi:hypothetical protein
MLEEWGNGLVKVDAPVGELAERSLLLELGRLFSILRAPRVSICRECSLSANFRLPEGTALSGQLGSHKREWEEVAYVFGVSHDCELTLEDAFRWENRKAGEVDGKRD